MPSVKPLPVIVSDLDGTLLDHDSYSFAPAAEALALITERAYPLILNSSKTRAEIIALQQDLGIRQAFICENGAAIYFPQQDTTWQCHSFAAPRDSWLPWVHALRAEYQLPFEGFSDWSAEQIAALTGLDVAQARLAGQREYSEPLLWQGDEDARLGFETQLASHELRLLRGGRFFSLQGAFDKATAMQWLKQAYYPGRPVKLIALGDSLNDCAMLNAADIAVIIQSRHSSAMQIEGPDWIIRTSRPGPAGWQEAMMTIMSEIDKQIPTDTGARHG